MLKHYNRTLSKEEWLVYLDIKYNNFGYLGTVSEANNRFIPKMEESDLGNPKVLAICNQTLLGFKQYSI